MTVKPWYEWDSVKECFVRSQRPPHDECLAKALKRVRIRLAGTPDRQKLLEFYREAYETEPEIWLPGEADLRKVHKRLDQWDPGDYPNDFIVVAELDRKIVGLLLLVICYRFDEGPSAWIEEFFVLKSFRGYKVATRLMEFAKRLAVKKGCGSMSVIVGLENPPALRLYRKSGFKIIKVGLSEIDLDEEN